MNLRSSGTIVLVSWLQLGVVPFAVAQPGGDGRMLPIFGPTQLTRGQGAPEAFSAMFRNCETSARFRLVVDNGNPDGTQRVSSAWVILNGTQIFGPSDFKQQVSRLERDIQVSVDNELRVSLASAPGSFLAVRVECSADCLGVQVLSPLPDSSQGPTTIVTGTVASTSDEVGVTVNGIPAYVHAGRFAVSGVPLAPGPNRLTVHATTACGNRSVASLDLLSNGSAGPPLRLTPASASGVAPLMVTVRADFASSAQVRLFEWDLDGDGSVDRSGPNLTEVSVTYGEAGLFLATVTVTDEEGNGVSETAPILVLSAKAFGAFAQERWGAFAAALAEGDSEAALQWVHPGVREEYRSIFAALRSQLPRVGASLGPIRLSSALNGVAELVTVRSQEGQERVYFIHFARDEDGLWKISDM